MNNSPLRILILAPDPRVMGGITTFTQMLIRNLPGCEVTWLPVGSLKGQRGKEDSREALWRRFFRLVGMPLRVVCMQRKSRFDVIHINTPFNRKGLIRDGLILAALHVTGMRRVLVYFHGWDGRVAQRIAKRRWLRAPLVGLLNHTGRVLVLAPEFREQLIAMGVKAEKILLTRTMFDGVECKAYAGSAPETAPNILFLSRFVREKGVYELVKAFGSIAQVFSDVQLIMAGYGKEDAGLKEYVALCGLETRVIFPGHVEGAAKWQLLHDCTLFALPTYYPEGMPIAVIEAMAAGKPLLTSRAGGLAAIIAEPENGIMLEHVTADSVAVALRRLLEGEAYRQETGGRNRQYAWAAFEAATVSGEIGRLYDTIRHA